MSELDNCVYMNHYIHCGVKWRKESPSSTHEDECPNCLGLVKADSSVLLSEDDSMLVMDAHGDCVPPK